jgi:hypothetical protein
MMYFQDISMPVILDHLKFFHLFILIRILLAAFFFITKHFIHHSNIHFHLFHSNDIPFSNITLFVGIISSDFTISRLTQMSQLLLTHPLFNSTLFSAAIFFPLHHGAFHSDFPSIITNCSSSVCSGICCRVTLSMRYFLTTKSAWFLRAIDDSWFNPDNLYLFIRQLLTFINPHQHIVIKGHMSPDFLHNYGRAYLHGGSPILMSRAAVIHALQYFPETCGAPLYPADDTTFSLIVNRSFPKLLDWADVRFAGALDSATNSTFRKQWSMLVRSHFVGFNQTCSSNGVYRKPLKRIVGVHSLGGVLQWREIVELASLSWFPNDLLLEYRGEKEYELCVNKSEAERLASVEYLKKVTPILKIDDVELRYSIEDLLNWGLSFPSVWWLPKFEVPERVGIREIFRRIKFEWRRCLWYVPSMGLMLLVLISIVISCFVNEFCGLCRGINCRKEI